MKHDICWYTFSVTVTVFDIFNKVDCYDIISYVEKRLIACDQI
jgi:hypothetical protein